MDALLGLLKGIAPTLATMVAGPLGGAAVSLIANKLGVEDAVSEVAKAIVGDPLAAQKIKEMELEFAKVEAANVADARALQVAALQQEDLFSKRFIYYFATVWSVFAMVYFSFATFGTIPESGVRVADTILGVLIGTVITGFFNFFFGSSKGSKDKDAIIKGMQ